MERISPLSNAEKCHQSLSFFLFHPNVNLGSFFFFPFSLHTFSLPLRVANPRRSIHGPYYIMGAPFPVDRDVFFPPLSLLLAFPDAPLTAFFLFFFHLCLAAVAELVGLVSGSSLSRDCGCLASLAVERFFRAPSPFPNYWVQLLFLTAARVLYGAKTFFVFFPPLLGLFPPTR